MKKETIITLRVDLDNPPPLTAEQKAELEALAEMPDSEIDLSDIPEHDFSGASVKHAVIARLDSDVFAWLRSFGEGYQNRINAILRNEMQMTQKAKA